jgi:hypothetical protein
MEEAQQTTTRNKQCLHLVALLLLTTITLQTMSKPPPKATSQKPAPTHVLMERSNEKGSNVSRGSGCRNTGSGNARTRTSSGSQNENPQPDSTSSNRSQKNPN